MEIKVASVEMLDDLKCYFGHSLEGLCLGLVASCIKDETCIGLYNGKRLIGWCCWVMYPRRIDIVDVFVDEMWRKRGLAYVLMHEAIKVARNHYSHEIDVEIVDDEQKYFKSIYEKNGTLEDNHKVDVIKLLKKAKKGLKRYNLIKD